MVQHGMTPMQAIVATTSVAAECGRFDRITGSLVAGKRADLLAIDGDPLADIKVLQDTSKFRLIMKDGMRHKDELGTKVLAN
jgi:imidazolonepropionase-like amidohydrolase